MLKRANITPVFKKGYLGSKKNYCLVSILPFISKIYERILFKQLTVFVDQNPSKFATFINSNVGEMEMCG